MTETSTELAVRSGGALAVGADQTAWTEQQLAVLRSAGVNADVTSAELTAFLHESQRTKLDPFTRQIYLIGRWDSQARRKVFRSQTGIDGYRVIAHRAAADTGEPLSYDDTLWCGRDGEWRDVWLADEPPQAAKVVIHRGRSRFSAVARLGEYCPFKDGKPTGLWGKMPATMLAKCAEALALRKAFPHDLSGIYTAEEMEQADARQPQTQVAEAVVRKAQREASGAPDPWVDNGVALTDDQSKPSLNSQRTRLILLVKDKRGVLDDEGQRRIIGELIGRQIASRKDLTFGEAHRAIKTLEREPDHVADAEVVDEPPPSEPNPRNGDAPVSAPVEAALSTRSPEDAAAKVADSDQLAADWAVAINAAETHASLDSIGRIISAAVQNGRLLEADRLTLEDLWRARKKELPPQQPPAEPDGEGWSHRALAETTGATL